MALEAWLCSPGRTPFVPKPIVGSLGSMETLSGAGVSAAIFGVSFFRRYVFSNSWFFNPSFSLRSIDGLPRECSVKSDLGLLSRRDIRIVERLVATGLQVVY